MPRTRNFLKLQVRIDDQIKSVSDSILRGDPKSYEAYKDWVGYIRGLRDAIKFADEIEGELD